MTDIVNFTVVLLNINNRIFCNNTALLRLTMNFSGRSQSLGDITGGGGDLFRGGVIRADTITSASNIASTPFTTTSAAEDADIFSHGSPIGDVPHPDESVLDSDDGEVLHTGSNTASESGATGGVTGPGSHSYVPAIHTNEAHDSNMDTSTNNSTRKLEHPLDAVYY